METACSELYEVNTRAESLIDLIRAVGAPNFGICVDAGHCHLNHLDVADMIRRITGEREEAVARKEAAREARRVATEERRAL